MACQVDSTQVKVAGVNGVAIVVASARCTSSSSWNPIGRYLSDDPSVNVMLDSLPVTLSEGEWCAPCSLWWTLLTPLAAAVINVVCAATYVP